MMNHMCRTGPFDFALNHVSNSPTNISSRSRENRMMQSIRKFAEKYHLGQPIAGNLYQAQYDDYVPKLHAQLSG